MWRVFKGFGHKKNFALFEEFWLCELSLLAMLSNLRDFPCGCANPVLFGDELEYICSMTSAWPAGMLRLMRLALISYSVGEHTLSDSVCSDQAQPIQVMWRSAGFIRL